MFFISSIFYYYYFRDQSIARKDLNAIEDNFKLLLSDEDCEIFKSQIEDDCKFFEKNNIIDYSLLIGIQDGLSEISSPKVVNLITFLKNIERKKRCLLFKKQVIYILHWNY